MPLFLAIRATNSHLIKGSSVFELAVISELGETVLDWRLKPASLITPELREELNLSEADVAGMAERPMLYEVWAELGKVLDTREVVVNDPGAIIPFLSLLPEQACSVVNARVSWGTPAPARMTTALEQCRELRSDWQTNTLVPLNGSYVWTTNYTVDFSHLEMCFVVETLAGTFENSPLAFRLADLLLAGMTYEDQNAPLNGATSTDRAKRIAPILHLRNTLGESVGEPPKPLPPWRPRSK